MRDDANRRMTAGRRVELLAWTLGLLALALYFGIRARQKAAARTELRSFEQARSTLARETPFAGPPLKWGEPDRSLWSPERVKAWRLSLAASTAPALAVLKIPKIHLEVPVLEGTDDTILDRGVGHIEGTALPGGPGNLGIAGHRDGFFRGLKDISPGDRITLETLGGSSEYVIEKVFLVKPDDVWILDDSASPELTLVTCFPFYYVGSAPQRYIVKARREAIAPPAPPRPEARVLPPAEKPPA